MKLIVPVILILFFILAVNVTADLQKGFDALNNKDYAAALTELKPLAEQGHPVAQCWLGEMYEYGNGVTQDLVEAVKWYSPAAEAGFPPCQVNLAIMYERGKGGISKNISKALSLYYSAAEQGYTFAQFTLGIQHEYGESLPKDLVLAYMWFTLASDFSLANERKENIVKDMTSSQVEQAEALAKQCLESNYKDCD